VRTAKAIINGFLSQKARSAAGEFYFFCIDKENVRYLYCCAHIVGSGVFMETITLSRKFQVVIPKKAREHLNLKPGQRLVVIEKGSSIELVKVGNIKQMRGTLKGISVEDLRDESDSFD